MLEEEKNEIQEEATETPTEETPVAEETTEETAPAAEEPAEEKAPEVEAAAETTEEKAEAPAEEQPAEETPAEETEEKAEETAEESVEEAPVVEEVPQTPHDEYDWSQSNTGGLSYSEKEIEEYLSQYEATLTSVLENEIVSGIVTSINSGDVVLDINYKSDGLISLSEFRDMPDLKIGDPVEVYVEKQEDERGQLVLSRRKAKLLRAWERIKDSYANGSVIEGTVISKTKGGLIVDCGGLETFLPGSQIDIKPIIDYDQYVGKTMEFKVVKINEQIKNAVVSHKALIESDLAEQREADHRKP